MATSPVSGNDVQKAPPRLPLRFSRSMRLLARMCSKWAASRGESLREYPLRGVELALHRHCAQRDAERRMEACVPGLERGRAQLPRLPLDQLALQGHEVVAHAAAELRRLRRPVIGAAHARVTQRHEVGMAEVAAHPVAQRDHPRVEAGKRFAVAHEPVAVRHIGFAAHIRLVGALCDAQRLRQRHRLAANRHLARGDGLVVLHGQLAQLHAKIGIHRLHGLLPGRHAVEEVLAVVRGDGGTMRRCAQRAQELRVALLLHGKDLFAEVAVLRLERRVQAVLAVGVAQARTLTLDVGTQGVPAGNGVQPQSRHRSAASAAGRASRMPPNSAWRYSGRERARALGIVLEFRHPAIQLESPWERKRASGPAARRRSAGAGGRLLAQLAHHLFHQGRQHIPLHGTRQARVHLLP